MSVKFNAAAFAEVTSNYRGFLGSSTEFLLSQTISRISSIWSASDRNQAPNRRQKPTQQITPSFPRRRESMRGLKWHGVMDSRLHGNDSGGVSRRLSGPAKPEAHEITTSEIILYGAKGSEVSIRPSPDSSKAVTLCQGLKLETLLGGVKNVRWSGRALSQGWGHLVTPLRLEAAGSTQRGDCPDIEGIVHI